jgi:hypothetical protein
LANLETWGLALTAGVAVVGWVRAATRNATEVRDVRADVARLEGRLDQFQPKADALHTEEILLAEIRLIRRLIVEMDHRRNDARAEIQTFRDKVSRELGAIKARVCGRPVPPNPETKNG